MSTVGVAEPTTNDRAKVAEQHILERIDSRIAAFFSSCVHCGICAETCHFYKEIGDPKYTPIYKVEPMRKIWEHHHTFWRKLLGRMGRSSLSDEQMLEEWQELVYDSCTLCGCCSVVCAGGQRYCLYGASAFSRRVCT